MFVNSLPASVREKLPLGCSSSKGSWTLWTTTASDSSPTSDVAISVVLCGTAGSSSPCLLVDEPSHTAGDQRRSLAQQTTRRRSAASTKQFKPSSTDQFRVSPHSRRDFKRCFCPFDCRQHRDVSFTFSSTRFS